VCADRWRFADEPCRHKALDLLGDLALLGRPLEAEVFAFMPGHRLNIAFARRVEKELEV
jgi:UDP-3-O-acyl-N-acetylglucosamine deacetylase